MLRAMILIVLSMVLLITILTQIVLPMFTDKLSFFWYFKKGSRDDIILHTPEKEVEDDLADRAHRTSKQYKRVKKEIKERRKELGRLDKETDIK